MIQIRQTKDDLAAKWLLLLAHTSGLHAAGMLGRIRSTFSADQARVVGDRIGDYALNDTDELNFWTYTGLNYVAWRQMTRMPP
jgi:hypothetical protein